MSSTTVSVIIASAQSVGKVYVIGAVGYFAVKFPRKAPLLPSKAVGTVARFGFHVLVIPLIYSTIANSVTAATIGNYWFVILAAFCVLAISFITATLLAIPFKLKTRDFATLRIAATFPNIVALPILIFPSLCEYKVVYDAFGDTNKADLYSSCVSNANTVIFLYFFAWSFGFWTFGYRHVMANNSENSENDGIIKTIWRGIKQTCTSPGFIAMILGFVTACIPPLQKALFDPGGYLRFLGAAVETLGVASSPISTMVVAASLVPPTREHGEEGEGDVGRVAATAEECNDDDGDEEANIATDDSSHTHEEVEDQIDPEDTTDVSEENVGDMDVEESREVHSEEKFNDSTPDDHHNDDDIVHESPIMSDPNFGPNHLRRRSSVYRFRQSIRRNSRRILAHRPSTERTSWEMRKLLVWFILSRLIVTPGIVVSIVSALNYANLWQGPDLTKLVIIINSALPGALIVVVLLKSQPAMADTAATVAKVYLPSYLLSIVTIAAWTALGLWISLPEEDGAARMM